MRSGLLGDDERERVRLFGHTKRCAVPRSSPPIEQDDLGQRKKATSCEDAVAPDDDGAVMQRRARRKEREQHLGAQSCIDIVPVSSVLVERGVDARRR